TALLGYVERYEGRYGKGTRNTFGGHALDAMLILRPAIERTLWQGIRPENTGGFRAVLRDQIEHGTKELVGITGIFNYTPTDHLGLHLRAEVIVGGRNGTRPPSAFANASFTSMDTSSSSNVRGRVTTSW